MASTPRGNDTANTVTRRGFLKTTGAIAGAAGLAPALSAPFVSRALADTKALSILQWAHFVPEYDTWFKEARKFGAAIWELTGKGNNVDFVFEHPGAATFPVSVLVVKRGGMVVICAGTTGYNLTMDARYLWMHQKRVQGSHFANLLQASQANKLVVERRIDPCMSEVFPWEQIPKAHMRMWKNEHKPGNMAVLVSAPRTGLRTFEDAIEASRKRSG